MESTTSSRKRKLADIIDPDTIPTVDELLGRAKKDDDKEEPQQKKIVVTATLSSEHLAPIPKWVVTSAKLTLEGIEVYLEPNTHAGAETVLSQQQQQLPISYSASSCKVRTVFPLPPSCIKEERPRLRIPYYKEEGDSNEEKTNNIHSFYQRQLQEYSSRFGWFIQHTTGLCNIPGLLDRAVSYYYEKVQHTDRMGWLGASLNSFAYYAAGVADVPCKLTEKEIEDRRARHYASADPIYLGTFDHLTAFGFDEPPESGHPAAPEGTERKTLWEKDNPFHLIAFFASVTQGWWCTYYWTCILHAIGRDGGGRGLVRVLLEYLAHESKCGGIRWYGLNGIKIDKIIADAIVFELGAKPNAYMEGWAMHLDHVLCKHYRGKIITRSGSDDF